MPRCPHTFAARTDPRAERGRNHPAQAQAWASRAKRVCLTLFIAENNLTIT